MRVCVSGFIYTTINKEREKTWLMILCNIPTVSDTKNNMDGITKINPVREAPLHMSPDITGTWFDWDCFHCLCWSFVLLYLDFKHLNHLQGWTLENLWFLSPTTPVYTHLTRDRKHLMCHMFNKYTVHCSPLYMECCWMFRICFLAVCPSQKSLAGRTIVYLTCCVCTKSNHVIVPRRV